MAEKLDTDPDLQLPEPQGLMSAKSYKTRFVEPLIAKLKALIKGLLVKYFQTWDDYNRANLKNGRLYRENEDLTFWKERLMEDNKVLVEQNRDYALLRKVFGSKKIDDLVAQAREMRYGSRHGRDRDYER